MISIVSVRLPTGDTPVATVALEPYVLIKRGDTVQSAEDLPSEGEPAGASPWQLRSRWYRSSIPRGGAVCSVHPEREAGLQCTVCLRARVAQHLSYHCSPECFRSSWPQHQDYHRQAAANPSEPGAWGGGRGGGGGGNGGGGRRGSACASRGRRASRPQRR
jgi:CCR4-NOT transcription complex subunit 6